MTDTTFIKRVLFGWCQSGAHQDCRRTYDVPTHRAVCTCTAPECPCSQQEVTP